jgi:lysyl-tRNA synthetase class 2
VVSNSAFVLRADKAFFFAHGGVLAYRTLRETAVVSGDPVGPPGSAPAIMAAFRAHARARGWDVVVMAAGEHHLAAYRALGLRALRIGSEAVAAPGAPPLDGRAHRTLRKAVNRVHRRGWTVEVVTAAALGTAQVRDLARVDRAWRARRPRVTGFAMAMDRLWGAEEDRQDVYVLGRAPDGALHGFLRFVPYGGGLSLDAMRRVGGEPNGFNEALVVAGLEHAAGAGCREVSLNFAGFAHVLASDAPLGRRARIARAALRLVHGRFQLERLARFNARFDPVWRPRYLVYESRSRLPRAALRVLQAEAYVRGPRPGRRPDAWWPAERPAGARPTTAEAGR